MRVTEATVVDQRDWVEDRCPVLVELINETRADLADQFGTAVPPVTESAVETEVGTVFADGDRAVNVAALVAILRDLDVAGDYPGFVVDELLGRELAALVAGDQPLRLLAEATFHYVDVSHHGDPGEGAGTDDLEAALAAGLQTRLPGWEWRTGDSPFGV